MPISNILVLLGPEALIASYPKDKPEVFGPCQAQEERQKGYGETVVEPGLDAQGLANADRDARVAHHGLAKRGVGGSEDYSHDGRLPEGEIGEHQRRYNGSQHDG